MIVPVEIKAPYHSYEDLRRKADEFLAKYHATGTIPVPIEEIVEFQFRMDIVPTSLTYTLTSALVTKK